MQIECPAHLAHGSAQFELLSLERDDAHRHHSLRRLRVRIVDKAVAGQLVGSLPAVCG